MSCVDQGDLTNALKDYRENLEIRETLAAQDPVTPLAKSSGRQLRENRRCLA